MTERYYAVRTGRQPGIYNTWEACREQVTGHKGAVFKSFKDRSEAEAFLLQADEQEPVKDNIPYSYIDGGYSVKNQCYSYGGFIVNNGQYTIIQGKGSNPKFIKERNIAGELLGTLQIVHECSRQGIKEINLFHDYKGIKEYISGAWEAQTPLAIYYRNTLDLLDNVKVYFHHVKGHTGIEGNEIADLLAKEAAGVQIRKKDKTALEGFRDLAGKAGTA